MILSTTVVMQSVKLLHYDNNKKSQPAAAMRLSSLNNKEERMWSVSIDGSAPTQRTESDLINYEK
jgi:hypothetical protein